MKISRRVGAAAISSLFLAVSAIGYGCGGDDSNGSGDDSSSDSGPGFDGTTASDGSLSTDSSTPTDSAVTDAGHDAGPPHIAFVTSMSFTGDLIGQARAIDADAGIDAGLSDDAGDGGTSYLAASDIICDHVAKSAGLPGKFAAIISAGTDHVLSRFTDADGPWALVNGTPVADTVADLASGKWRTSIDHTETGTDISTNDLYPWGKGITADDCDGWSSNLGALSGAAGSNANTSLAALTDGDRQCNLPHPIFCAEVGAGAGPNRYPPVPAGGKIAFVADGPFPSNFALSDAGVLDGSAPDAGDAVHTVGDAICNQVARGAGQSGKFHAWVSSTTIDAKTYFTNLSMNGPWYRPDGAEVAATLLALDTTGAQTQVEIGANGAIVSDLGSPVFSGTNFSGALGFANCIDFTTLSSGVSASMGRTSYKDTDWASRNGFACGSSNGLYCFEE